MIKKFRKKRKCCKTLRPIRKNSSIQMRTHWRKLPRKKKKFRINSWPKIRSWRRRTKNWKPRKLWLTRQMRNWFREIWSFKKNKKRMQAQMENWSNWKLHKKSWISKLRKLTKKLRLWGSKSRNKPFWPNWANQSKNSSKIKKPNSWKCEKRKKKETRSSS